jgi:ribosomal protein S18 acetylase RimI-like enzyme
MPPDGNSPSWTIRSFRPTDARACAALYKSGLLHGKIPASDTGIDLDDIEHVYMKSPGNHFWVAESSAGEVIGMVGVQHHDEGVGEIRRLRVAERHQRQGIGSALVERALAFCQERQYLKITLDTFMDREPAIKLFQKFHFRHYSTRNVGGKDLLYFYLDLYSGNEPPREKA